MVAALKDARSENTFTHARAAATFAETGDVVSLATGR
jgi:hypothetical protein